MTDHGFCARCGWHDEWHYADGRCPVGIRGKGEQVDDINYIAPRRMTMLPPAPEKCQECAVEHEPEQPHNKESLYYQMRFNAEHGRWPTWLDAMAHCADDVKWVWQKELTAAGVILIDPAS